MGENFVVADILKQASEVLIEELLLNKCLDQECVPENWKNSLVIVICKQKNPEDLENYRPINLFSQIYNTFSKIITNHLKPTFDFF